VTDPTRGVDRHEAVTPDPDDPRKPDSPGDLTKRSWFYVARKTVREFVDDECTDLAAALTYYAVLSIFPAAIALTSLLGVVGAAEDSVDMVLEVLEPLVAPETLGTIEPALREVAGAPGAGLALVLGLAVALWTASNYINAFSRAMNRIYEIGEGRPFWKLRPIMVLITFVALLLLAVVLLLLILSGPLARSIGDQIGLSDTTYTIWSIAKWPVIAVAVMLIVAVLYWATPNVQQPKFRWLSVGAVVAIVTLVVAGAAFAFYVSKFGSYNKTYGSLAGVIIALVFLWISNLALLFGAEIDAELERGRQLQAGIPAERDLQLPARDTRQIRKARKKEQKDIELGRRIREEHGADDRSPDHPTTHEEER
jgi:membrane protein